MFEWQKIKVNFHEAGCVGPKIPTLVAEQTQQNLCQKVRLCRINHGMDILWKTQSVSYPTGCEVVRAYEKWKWKKILKGDKKQDRVP